MRLVTLLIAQSSFTAIRLVHSTQAIPIDELNFFYSR
jgi:hypothetical protein